MTRARSSSWFDVKRFVGAAVMFITLAAIMPSLVDRFWPASYWVDMQEVHVADAPQGQSPAVTETRIVKRKVRATYNAEVEVKQFEPKAGYRLVCRASGGPFEYDLDNLPPDNLAAWVDDSCMKAGSSGVKIDVRNLPVGVYRMETCRTILPARIFSEKRECATSNDFTIFEPPGL